MCLRGRQDVSGARPGGNVLDVAAQVGELVLPVLHAEFGGDLGVVTFCRGRVHLVIGFRGVRFGVDLHGRWERLRRGEGRGWGTFFREEFCGERGRRRHRTPGPWLCEWWLRERNRSRQRVALPTRRSGSRR